MSVYAIGDIHGCFTALELLFKVSGISQNDSVVFLGDYIDRGPQSKETINWIIEKIKDGYSFVTLRGNHEFMIMDAKRNVDKLLYWLNFGGANTLDSYNIGDNPKWYSKIPNEHWDFFEKTIPYYENENNIFVHAGLSPALPLERQAYDKLFWELIKKPQPHISGKRVVCGHTAQTKGKIGNFKHTLMIDTFAFGDGWLSCIDTETGEYWQTNQSGDSRNGKITLK